MSTLQGKDPKDTYKDLLQVSNSNVGIDATLRPLESGGGTQSAVNISTDAIAPPVVTRVPPVTDVAPGGLLAKSADAWPGAATNIAGANTILAGGIGRRIYTIIAYSHGSMAGSTVTITVNGTATVKTEGADWTAATSNDATATSLAAAIDAISGVSATAVAAVVRITPDVGTYSLTVAKSAADAGMTATSGTDGVIAPKSIISVPGGTWASPAIQYGTGALGFYKVDEDTLVLASPTAPLLRSFFFGCSVYNRLSYDRGLQLPGDTTTVQISWGPNALYGSDDVGGARGGVKLLKVTDGSTGSGSIEASTAITAVGTAAANGYIRTGVYKRAWTNAEVTAFGAVLSGNLKIATLPAKTIPRNAYLVIDSQASGTTTLTVSLGRTSTAYVDYIVASDAKVAANTVYGDAVGERGTNLTGHDLPSYTTAVDIYVQFVATGANLDQVTTCTGTIYLLTEILP